jgi:tetratricopeptide (TPR) repeat protein
MRAPRRLILSVFTPLLAVLVMPLTAQPPQARGGPGNELIHQGTQLDLQGKGDEARTVFQKAIDTAPTPAAKANAQRAMAMSWAFDGNCKKTAEYEELVIDYWKTQEKDAPDRAFYQQGEMANEAARVCLDNGDLNAAHELYKKGRDLGLKEPGVPPARKDLWDYRWEHAQARIAARRGNKAEAAKHVDAAKTFLADMKPKDPKLYEQQAAFLPYLTGYVALYTGDYKTALEDLQKANQKDAFIQCLIGMTYEKLGDKTSAMEAYRKAAAAGGHNPPAAFARPFTRKKLAEG